MKYTDIADCMTKHAMDIEDLEDPRVLHTGAGLLLGASLGALIAGKGRRWQGAGIGGLTGGALGLYSGIKDKDLQDWKKQHEADMGNRMFQLEQYNHGLNNQLNEMDSRLRSNIAGVRWNLQDKIDELKQQVANTDAPGLRRKLTDLRLDLYDLAHKIQAGRR